MAHAARVLNGIVQEVIVIDNDTLPNDGEFSSRNEVLVNEYLQGLGLNGEWRLTSYNARFRGIFAAPGMNYQVGPEEFYWDPARLIYLSEPNIGKAEE